MTKIASQIPSLTIVYSTVYSGADQSKHQSSASLVFVWGIHRGPVHSPHKWPVTRKMFPLDDVIMFHPHSHGLLHWRQGQEDKGSNLLENVCAYMCVCVSVIPRYLVHDRRSHLPAGCCNSASKIHADLSLLRYCLSLLDRISKRFSYEKCIIIRRIKGVFLLEHTRTFIYTRRTLSSYREIFT